MILFLLFLFKLMELTALDEEDPAKIREKLLGLDWKSAFYSLKKFIKKEPQLALFLEIFDSLHQQVFHLISIAKFQQVANTCSTAWLEILVLKGMKCENHRIRKAVAEWAMELCEEYSAEFFLTFLAHLDDKMFVADEAGAFECKFGTRLANVLSRYIANAQSVNLFLSRIHETVKSRMACVFTLYGALIASDMNSGHLDIQMDTMLSILKSQGSHATKIVIAKIISKLLIPLKINEDTDPYVVLEILSSIQLISPSVEFKQYLVDNCLQTKTICLALLQSQSPRLESYGKSIGIISAASGFAADIGDFILAFRSSSTIRPYHLQTLEYLTAFGNWEHNDSIIELCLNLIDGNSLEVETILGAAKILSNKNCYSCSLFVGSLPKLLIKVEDFLKNQDATFANQTLAFACILYIYLLSFAQIEHHIYTTAEIMSFVDLYSMNLPKDRGSTSLSDYTRFNDTFMQFKFKSFQNFIADADPVFAMAIFNQIYTHHDQVAYISLVTVFDLLHEVLQKIDVPAIELTEILEYFSEFLLSDSRKTNWGDTNDAFLKVCLHRRLLSSPSLYGKFVSSIWERYVKLGQRKLNVVPSVASHFISYWNAAHLSDELSLNSLIHFADIFVQMLCYGESRIELVTRQEAIIALMARQPINSDDKIEKFATAEWNFYLKDYFVRVQAIVFLLRLNQSHSSIAKILFDSCLKMFKSRLCQTKFTKTEEHRRAMRLLLALHVLLNLVPKNSLKILFKPLVHAMITETIAETRALLEWLVARILLYDPELFPKFFRYCGINQVIMTARG
jgi:hypothetical protein